MFSVLIASGIASGLLYGLIALGVVVLSKAADAVNFSQGDIVAGGGFLSYSILVAFGLGAAYALFGVVVASALIGVAIYFIVRPLLKPQHAAALLIATIGLSFFFKGIIRIVWGGQGDYLAIPPLVSGPPIILMGGSIIIPLQALVMMGGALVILVLFSLFFRFTRLGLFMRAVADNPRAATIVGIPTSVVLCSAIVVSVVVTAVAGFLLAPSTLLYPDMGFPLFLKGFAAAIIGGVTSLPGAVIGGICLGLTEVFVSGYIATKAQDLSAFVLIFITLVFFPRGLFGAIQRRSV